MRFNVREIDSRYDFEITGMSYIGNPLDGTCLFLGAKIAGMLVNLKNHRDCLVFIDASVPVPEEYREKNCFVLAENPQKEYGLFSLKMQKMEEKEQEGWQYRITPEGYTVGENVVIGEDARIEPGCLIDHNVQIGRNAQIGFGSVIRNADIGDDFICHEYSVIGTESFNLGEAEGYSYRIPSFGKIRIGNHVDLGARVIIERGFNSETVIGNNSKIDSDVNIGHDVILKENVKITCGACLAGRVVVCEGAYIGMNATVRQRIIIGSKATVGMGASVLMNVRDGETVVGNPAKKMKI